MRDESGYLPSWVQENSVKDQGLPPLGESVAQATKGGILDAYKKYTFSIDNYKQ